MEDRKSYNLTISDEAMAIVEKWASERTKGKAISEVIVDYHKLVSMGGDNSGVMERIEAKLDYLCLAILQIDSRLPNG